MFHQMRRVVRFARDDLCPMRHSRGHRGGRAGPRGPDRRTLDAPSMRGAAPAWFGRPVQERSRERGRGKRRRQQTTEAPSLQSHRDLEWYRTLFGRCIDQELREEQLQVEARLRTWSLARLLREGYTLVRCRARPSGRLFEKPIVRFSQTDGSLSPHIFSQGDLVTITKSSPLECVDAEGVVYEKRMSFLSVVFEKVPRDLCEVEWRLDKGSNKVAYERMHQALTEMTSVNHPLPLWLRACVIPSALAHLDPQQQSMVPDTFFIQKASLLTAKLTDKRQEVDDALRSMQTALPLDKTNATREELQKNAFGAPCMNESQIDAICNGLESRLSLIQGPPGTGKTWTAVHLIKAWRTLHPSAGPILATAQSNVAVDQLLSGCLKLGLNAVRLGLPVRVTEDLQGRTLDALLQQHPRMQEVESIRKEIQYLHSCKGTVSGRDIGFLHRDLGLNAKKLQTLMDEISREVVASADVVCATCIGAGSDLLKGTRFKFMVLDESTQCTEPEGLVPLMKANEDASVVLIGDHQQLPPTVLSQDQDTRGILSVSLFQRFVVVKEQIMPSHPVSSALSSLSFPREQIDQWSALVEPFFKNMRTSMLREQYRMHPILSHWPSQRFYDGELKDAVTLYERLPPAGIPWTLRNEENGDRVAAPLLFVSSTSEKEETSSNSQSKFNNKEAQIVVSAVNRLLREGAVPHSRIGVISPYTAQVHTIKNLLAAEGYSIAREDWSSDDSPGNFIEVKTVDGYQGREKDVIVFSAVRSNANGEIGFLNDYRRFNVAVTRARRGLIIVGNPETLKADALWNAWLQYVEQNRYIIEERHIL